MPIARGSARFTQRRRRPLPRLIWGRGLAPRPIRVPGTRILAS